MKNIERKPQTQRVQPFKRIGEFVVGRPLLTREDKQELKVYRESLRMIGEQAREQRAKEPKVQLSIEAWRTYVAERLRFEQFESQATARGETYNPDTQYGLYETLTPENKNTVDFQLAKEAKDGQFDQMAELIQTEIWKDTPFRKPSVTIKPAHEVNIGIKDDGTVINNSRSGVTISYIHPDIQKSDNGEKAVRVPQTELLHFGIGYFSDRTHIVPEAQASVSDEDLQIGIKAYFVQRTYTVETDGKLETRIEISAIPLIYADNEQTFYKHLYNGAKSISPEKVLPEAKQRKRAARRNKEHAAAA